MTTLPDNTGYVAAAYVVFLALVLVYFAIMAAKLAKIERGLAELTALPERTPEQEAADLVDKAEVAG